MHLASGGPTKHMQENTSSILPNLYIQNQIKEDIGKEQQLYEIVRGKNFALNCLSWKFTEMIMIANKVIPENLVVVC